MADLMKKFPKDQNTDESFTEAQRQDDELGEIMEQEGITSVNMPEMSRKLESLRPQTRKEQGSKDEEEDIEGELEDLLDDKTPVLGQSAVFGRDLQHETEEKQNIELEQQPSEGVDYPESFASQKETSQLREEMEAMSEEVKDLKKTITSLLKEREALPTHLSTVREDINRQMTLMMEKLHGALESDIVQSNVGAAAATLDEVKERSVERLAAAEDYARDQPRHSSPLATKGAELKGKRRFRPVK